LDKVRNERSPRIKRNAPSRSSSADLTERPSINTDDYSMEPLRKMSFAEVSFKDKTWDSIEIDPNNEFNVLPIESVLLIFSFLESNDLANIRLVNKECLILADDDLIWKNLCVYDWNVHSKTEDTWKGTYFRIKEIFSGGPWEGMSKWVEPTGFDNEQKTTAELCFHKRRLSKLVRTIPEVEVSPKDEAKPEETVDQKDKNYKNSTFRIVGGGITINCASPSPFNIEGERVLSDPTGLTFEWNKHFEKHTSTYNGKLNLKDGTVNGTIDYHDGTTHWKGVFFYTKPLRTKRIQVNA